MPRTSCGTRWRSSGRPSMSRSRSPRTPRACAAPPKWLVGRPTGCRPRSTSSWHSPGRVPSPSDARSVDLAEVVAEVAQEYDAEASTRGVRLSWLAPSGLLVEGDRTALKRAQANLVSNALRVAPSGSVVHCRAGRADGWLWLGVRDLGHAASRPTSRPSSSAAPGAMGLRQRKAKGRAWGWPSCARSPRHMAARSAWPRSPGRGELRGVAAGPNGRCEGGPGG